MEDHFLEQAGLVLDAPLISVAMDVNVWTGMDFGNLFGRPPAC